MALQESPLEVLSTEKPQDLPLAYLCTVQLLCIWSMITETQESGSAAPGERQQAGASVLPASVPTLQGSTVLELGKIEATIPQNVSLLGPRKNARQWPFGLLVEALGYYFAYFWGPGTPPPSIRYPKSFAAPLRSTHLGPGFSRYCMPGPGTGVSDRSCAGSNQLAARHVRSSPIFPGWPPRVRRQVWLT